MASPPFNIAETIPANSDQLSAYPAAERTFRDIVESWFLLHSDPNTGLLLSTALPSPLLTSTDAGAGVAPNADLYRNSASAAALDLLAALSFNGNDNLGNKTLYGRV